MMTSMDHYTVKQLAVMAGVSVRTLHHYDEIGLLVPTGRSRAGYRLYGRPELLRLQQILLWRELGMELGEIGRTLDAPGHDPVDSLVAHRARVEARMAGLRTTLATIDRTLAHYKENTMLKDEELYEGIAPETAKAWRAEACERWDPALVSQSEQRFGRLDKAARAAVMAESAAINAAMAAVMAEGKAPGSPEAQAVCGRHWAWLGNFYEPTAELYEGLGRMYADDERFAANYEKVATGLASYMAAAMAVYARGR